MSDPPPSPVVTHVTVTREGLKTASDQNVPSKDEGSFDLLRSKRKYTWTRTPFDVSFMQGRIVLTTHVNANIELPISSVDAGIDIKVLAEPVISIEYKVKLQSTEVKVTSEDRKVKVADHVAGVTDGIAKEIDAKLKDFVYDLKPPLEEAYARVSKPIDFPLGDAKGCAFMKVVSIERPGNRSWFRRRRAFGALVDGRRFMQNTAST